MGTGPQLHLVLPHQLFEDNLRADEGTRFVMIEHDLLFRQYPFHAHKLVLHKASMNRFARRLRGAGYAVDVLPSEDSQTSSEQLTSYIRDTRPARVTCFDVVDDWLGKEISSALKSGGYDLTSADVFESPNFLTTRTQLGEWFGQNTARMQDFYIWQRRRLNVLVDDDGAPQGGKWSYDEANRKKLPRGYRPPSAVQFDGTHSDVERAIRWVADTFPDAPGDPHSFAWPSDADEARAALHDFTAHRLADFGPYEDAISSEHALINHSAVTAWLNIGLLSPAEVLRSVLNAAAEQHTPLASLEGFVRQLIGWREYMRATYHLYGQRMRTSNRLGHDRELSSGWWDGTTGLDPVDLVITRVLETGYAHHIERLMILGNAMCLQRIHPTSIYEWFMEMFIDSYDWVMVPNVYAMSQFAAGTAITTKPYVSGSNYLRKMSDLGRGDWAADWDGLYWAFMSDHREVFESNHRARMMPRMLDDMDPSTRAEHMRRAKVILSSQDS
ncbi:MAG TPA: cryptochrome/photolyase family protein [Candidatus Nesterenkonia stercoripullorum]|uniref:Cryptochrome/photolyase family protein n=1 Tax=Candidatus Nesterenkonia stercoripullorum TaxID=2838701 RepID=A0A9D1RZG2_9MICC|nr:cryptochrome/photolyase family protein [Candidatus Nesterenkonia stercoripullorum]